MVFKIDFINDKTVSWNKTDSGVEATSHPDYFPRFYLDGKKSKLQKTRPWLSRKNGVISTSFEKWKPTLSKPETDVLRVDVEDNEKLKKVTRELKRNFSRSSFKFYNVGFSPQFRFCLQNNLRPLPEKDLKRVNIELSREKLAKKDITGLSINGENLDGNNIQVLEQFKNYWKTKDPDLILVNRGQVLELLVKKMKEHYPTFSLGRMDKFQRLAGENTVNSYGQTLHSSARYNIPGRIVVDKSNSFLLGEATLEGLWDLVNRSYRPMQELAWGSIGRLLTSIEVKKAYLEENTLTPWKNWSGETPKKASKLHKADRGGFIFNPEPSIHQDVYEADFASLFPNIMVEKNISPETVCCDCCENNKTPELDYSICNKQEGFIGKVLRPLIDDRQEMKKNIDDVQDEEERKYMQGSIDAIKWILVSCFGYMGHSHASYGAIECHQAIQAYDRDIMIKTKEMLENSGYTISHGIIDSIWVQEKQNATNFDKVCEEISDEIGIKLEPEHRFEWCAFVSRSSSEANISTLNRYFGKKTNGEFKTAGIEVEQNSTCEFVKNAQMEMIKALDRTMTAETVLNELSKQIDALERMKVSPKKLVKKKKVSKTLENYKVENRSVSTLKRAKHHGIDIRPGQTVKFVVRDDNVDPMNRTRLHFEAEPGDYDVDFYRTQLIRATESILSPLGLDRKDIKRRFNRHDTTINKYT